ncbi:MAG TPA: GxxExxY protein [Gemmataceae bacterium]|nr:GxxExxY protein [Gemmataceae bacterium]
MEHDPIPSKDEELARQLIGAAIEVHRTLGPGFLESIYRRALRHELSILAIPFEYEKKILVPYKEIKIPGQRLDIVVAGRIILEVKTVEIFAPIHQAQLISYLKATGLRLGFLINFNTQVLKNGIKRVVR